MFACKERRHVVRGCDYFSNLKAHDTQLGYMREPGMDGAYIPKGIFTFLQDLIKKQM